MVIDSLSHRHRLPELREAGPSMRKHGLRHLRSEFSSDELMRRSAELGPFVIPRKQADTAPSRVQAMRRSHTRQRTMTNHGSAATKERKKPCETTRRQTPRAKNQEETEMHTHLTTRRMANQRCYISHTQKREYRNLRQCKKAANSKDATSESPANTRCAR